MAAYDPVSDSSEATGELRTALVGTPEKPYTGVILKVTGSQCLCGCGEQPSGNGRKFRMGHDARYRGKLIRAYVAGESVVIVDPSRWPEGWRVFDADELANELDWCQYLETAKRREDRKLAEKLERANAKLLAKATGPQVGDTRLIRVGRWDYTGQAIAIYELDGESVIEFQYVTKQGEVKRVRKPRAEFADEAVA